MLNGESRPPGGERLAPSRDDNEAMDEERGGAKANEENRAAAIMARCRVGGPTPDEEKLIAALVFTRDHFMAREALGAGASPLIEYMGRSMAYWATLDGADQALPELARACFRLGVEDIVDSEGSCLMDYATTAPSPRTMSLLFFCGADPDAKFPAGGHTALMIVCMVGSAECAVVALAHGASVDAVDSEGKTALFHAARRGHAHCASLLLEAGADPKIKDDSGRTPWDIAREGGKLGCLAFLDAWELGALALGVGQGRAGAGKPRI